MMQRARSTKTTVAVISSHVARGTVGNRATVFALETLGFPVWAIPTVTLPWHPGHGPAPRIVPDDNAFADMVGALAASPYVGEVGAVLSGYLGSPAQADAIAGLVGAVRQANPDALYVCDPVIGDAGGLYVPEETAAAIRDRLYAIADVVSPNRYEFEWLAGRQMETNGEIVAEAERAQAGTVLVTSAYSLLAGGTGNLLVDGGRALLAEHRHIDNPPNGPGDLTAALFTGHVLAGETSEKALQRATASVYELVSRTCKRGADELMLETDADCLSRPMAMVQVRQMAIAHPPKLA